MKKIILLLAIYLFGTVSYLQANVNKKIIRNNYTKNQIYVNKHTYKPKKIIKKHYYKKKVIKYKYNNLNKRYQINKKRKIKLYNHYMTYFLGYNWKLKYNCKYVWFRPSFNAIGYTCYYNHRIPGQYYMSNNYFIYINPIYVKITGYYYNTDYCIWTIFTDDGKQLLVKNTQWKRPPMKFKITGFYINGNYIFF